MTNRINFGNNRVGNALIIIGFSLSLLCIAYTLFTIGGGWVATELRNREDKSIVIAGILTVTEGTVTRADSMTKIAYYYYWDGATYYKVIPYSNPDYPENAKVVVVYMLGVGPGDCLVTGFYLNRFIWCGVAGLIMIILGIIGKEWRRRKWQEERL